MKKLIPIIIVAVILLIPFVIYQNKHIVTTEYIYSSPKADPDLDGFTIVQISDLHNATFGNGNKTLIDKVKALSPDIVVITGDLNYSSHTNISSALQVINAISKEIPVYYVTGNHEYYIDTESRSELIKSVIEAGAILLNNEGVQISKGKGSFLLAGLDDNNLSDDTLAGLLNGNDEMSVVLAHEPQNIKNYAQSGADLVLSGHAHGGQIRLPFIGAVIAPDQGFFPKYTSGVHTLDNTQMIISRGLGSSVIPIRLFNYPEIVCVKIKTAE